MRKSTKRQTPKQQDFEKAVNKLNAIESFLDRQVSHKDNVNFADHYLRLTREVRFLLHQIA